MKNYLSIALLLYAVIGSTLRTNAAQKVKGEYYFDHDPGQGNAKTFELESKKWVSNLDSLLEKDMSRLDSTKSVLVGIRICSFNGKWSNTILRYSDDGVFNVQVRNNKITMAEYFFGLQDPGQGSGELILSLDGALDESIEELIKLQPTWQVASGPTLFNLRVMDGNGNWSPLYKRTIFPQGANGIVNLIEQGDTMHACPNSLITLHYSGPVGLDYHWFNGSQNATVSFLPEDGLWYGIEALSNGQTIKDSIFVIHYPMPDVTLSATGPISICPLTEYLVEGVINNDYNYQWYLNNQVLLDEVSYQLLIGQAGNYLLQIANQFGCIHSSEVLAVDVINTSFFPNIIIDAVENPVCSTDEFQLVSLVSNIDIPYQLQWYKNGLLIFDAVSPTCQTQDYSAGDMFSCQLTSLPVCGVVSSAFSSELMVEVVQSVNWFVDNDSDSFGDESYSVQSCNQPIGYVSNGGDCNDNNAFISINASEVCGDFLDNNCNLMIDENCLVWGCTNFEACNYNPMANSDDGSCVLPQIEICNELDDNCNGEIDEGLGLNSVTAVGVTTNLYPICSGSNIKSANLFVGQDSPIIQGNGSDLWYAFTAQTNTFRAGLSAAFGQNSLHLFSMSSSGCMQSILTEGESNVSNQVLMTDELIPGENYYLALHHVSGNSNASAKICFNHLIASSCDHYYSNNTGVYTSVCNSFKAQFKANASAYSFNVIAATQNNMPLNIIPWSYTTATANSVVSRLGNIIPANFGASPIRYYIQVPVHYTFFDAGGNLVNLTALPIDTCSLILNAQLPISMRVSDRCPNNKPITSSISIDRTVCGAMGYEWEFTQVLPNVGPAQLVQGPLYSSVFFINSIPGVNVGNVYNVRVRPTHISGVLGTWGTYQCLRIGSAGMQPFEGFSAEENYTSSVKTIVFPNPTVQENATIYFLDEPNIDVDKISIFNSAGRLAMTSKIQIQNHQAQINVNHLAPGLYLFKIGDSIHRVIIGD